MRHDEGRSKDVLRREQVGRLAGVRFGPDISGAGQPTEAEVKAGEELLAALEARLTQARDEIRRDGRVTWDDDSGVLIFDVPRPPG